MPWRARNSISISGAMKSTSVSPRRCRRSSIDRPPKPGMGTLFASFLLSVSDSPAPHRFAHAGITDLSGDVRSVRVGPGTMPGPFALCTPYGSLGSFAGRTPDVRGTNLARAVRRLDADV